MNCVMTEITDIGDPFVLYDGGVYYMYATSSPDGFIVWKGTSLDNLKNCGLCYEKENSFGYACFWAPEVVKRSDGKYVMHFTAKDRSDGKLRTGVAVSDSPLGPFSDVEKGRPMFDIGTATLDATCFIDDDKAYLYFVKDCSTNIIDGIHTSQIYVAPLDESLTKLVGEPTLIATPSQEWETHSLPAPCVEQIKEENRDKAYLWNEGPAVIKHEGKYILTYSANCFDSRDYSVGVAESDSPLGPFVKYADNPAMSYTENISGPGHNSFFYDGDGNLICVFHCHTHYDAPSGDRRMCYCRTDFEKGKLRILYK